MFLFLCPQHLSAEPISGFYFRAIHPHKKIGRLDCEPPKMSILDVIQGITQWT